MMHLKIWLRSLDIRLRFFFYSIHERNSVTEKNKVSAFTATDNKSMEATSLVATGDIS